MKALIAAAMALCSFYFIVLGLVIASRKKYFRTIVSIPVRWGVLFCTVFTVPALLITLMMAGIIPISPNAGAAPMLNVFFKLFALPLFPMWPVAIDLGMRGSAPPVLESILKISMGLPFVASWYFGTGYVLGWLYEKLSVNGKTALLFITGLFFALLFILSFFLFSNT
jgi:hypothetical protein